MKRGGQSKQGKNYICCNLFNVPDGIVVRSFFVGAFRFSGLHSARKPARESAKSIPCALPVMCRCVTQGQSTEDKKEKRLFLKRKNTKKIFKSKRGKRNSILVSRVIKGNSSYGTHTHTKTVGTTRKETLHSIPPPVAFIPSQSCRVINQSIKSITRASSSA